VTASTRQRDRSRTAGGDRRWRAFIRSRSGRRDRLAHHAVVLGPEVPPVNGLDVTGTLVE
jgi:hypothetical protein